MVRTQMRFRNQTKKYSGLLNVCMVLSFVNVGYTKSNEDPPLKLCTSNECLLSAANLKLSMDLSVDPCDDFDKYACGKWSDIHPNVKMDSTYNAYDTIDEKISISIMNIFMDKDANTPFIRKARSFYWACKDMDTRNNLGLTPLYKILTKVKLPVIPHYILKEESERDNFTFNWIESETLIKQYFGMDVFIGAGVKVDPYNVSQIIFEIGTIKGTNYLPSPQYPEDDKNESTDDKANNEDESDGNKESTENNDKGSEKKSKKLIAKTNIIKYVLTKMLENSTGTIPEDYILQDAVDIILGVENALEEIYMNYTLTEEENPPAISLEDLQSQTDDYLSSSLPNFWLKYLKCLFKGTDVKIHPEKLMVHTTVGDLEYMNLMLQYISTTPDINLELYMWWVTVEQMILSTSSDVIFYVTEETGDSYESYAGPNEQCIRLVKRYMGYAITYALAEEMYPNTTRIKIGKMMRRLKTAFEDHVNELDWMDNATKKVTLEKSREMISFVGYPDWLFKKGALEKYYSELYIAPDAHLRNLINRIAHYNLAILKSFNEKHKRSWHNDAFDESEPISANAFYSPEDNAMDIPMGILTFPMYDLGLEVLNYGALVTTLGHELTHGFDNRGRKRDKYGNSRQWWSNSTIEAFADLVECFVEQYSNITIEGFDGLVDGRETLGENVADNGGLHQAFSAYKSFQNSCPIEPKLPGFENFSDDQMFFIAYASTWCKTTTTTAREVSMKSDNYAPFSVRLLASLQNSKDFSRAFNCSEGSFMNPEKKCKIW